MRLIRLAGALGLNARALGRAGYGIGYLLTEDGGEPLTGPLMLEEAEATVNLLAAGVDAGLDAALDDGDRPRAERPAQQRRHLLERAA